MGRYEDQLRIAERAAQWHVVFSRTGHRSPGEQERMEFLAWLEESPHHVREFLLLQMLEVESQGIDPERKIDLEAIIGRISTNVLALPSWQIGQSLPQGSLESISKSLSQPSSAEVSQSGDSRGGRRRWTAGMAAAVVAIAFLGWHVYSGQTYSTTIGEQRSVELSDGSKMELNAGSRIHVWFSDKARDVELEDGEALFDVERDPNRPFRVHSGSNVIQAVGTQFTVDRRPLGTVVAVLQGSVKLYSTTAQDASSGSSATQLPPDRQAIVSAGEQVRIDSTGGIQQHEPVEKANVSWQQHRLVFRDDALVDIAAEFNRYNRKLQIVVEDDLARTKRYGGIFDAEDPESIIAFVSQDTDLSVRRENGRVLISGIKSHP